MLQRPLEHAQSAMSAMRTGLQSSLQVGVGG